MNREVKVTNDGSKTLFINDLNEGYHSGHGALQEAVHVFINNGLKLIKDYEINILELGFGTGLNVLVTIDEFLKTDKSHHIHYHSIEKYPVSLTEVYELNYNSLFDNKIVTEANQKIHEAEWNKTTEIVPGFFLTKYQADFFKIKELNIPKADLVYFDCFGARVQPDLWEKALFELVSENMKSGGLLTTYASKGSVRRILKDLDFDVQKKPGPPGKREMINAWKP